MMDTFLIKATQLIMAFALLVIIHEFGHFLFARIFGVKVEKFYIFFDPWTELFKWKPKKYIGGFGKQRDLKTAASQAPADSNDSGKDNDGKKMVKAPSGAIRNTASDGFPSEDIAR